MSNVTWMFAPAEDLGRMEELAGVPRLDAMIPDLEDSTAYTDTAKANARRSIVELAQSNPDRTWELHPRINSLTSSYWRDDVTTLVPLEPAGLMVPEAASAERIKELSVYIGEIEQEQDIEVGSVKISAMFEHPIGVQNAYEIACCDERVERIALGTEDYTSNLGGLRDDEERFATLRSGIDYARGKIAQDAAAAGVTAIEGSPFTIGDEEYIMRESLKLARMGYEGRAALYREQIKPILRGFAPSRREIERARKLLDIIEDSTEKEQAPIEALERTDEIGNTKISSSLAGQSRLILERYEHIGAREET